VLGLFIASLVLSTLVAGVSLFAPRSAQSAAGRTGTVRGWTLRLAGFGVVGAALAVAGVSGLVALAVAAVVGGLFARVVAPLLDDASGDVGLGWLSGAAGHVVLPIDVTRGKVAVRTERGRIELPARSDDGRPIARGAQVIVAFVEGGEATVMDLGSVRARGRAPR